MLSQSVVYACLLFVDEANFSEASRLGKVAALVRVGAGFMLIALKAVSRVRVDVFQLDTTSRVTTNCCPCKISQIFTCFALQTSKYILLTIPLGAPP